MGQVISFFNPKGGVGKSTSCRMMAYLLAQNPNNTVLVIDLCQNSSAALNFTGNREQFAGRTIYEFLTEQRTFEEVVQPVEEFENLYFIPSDEKVEYIQSYLREHGLRKFNLEQHLTDMLKPLTKYFTHILIDTHPSQGDFNTISALLFTDNMGGQIIIPTFLDLESIESSKQAIKIVAANFSCEYIVLPVKIKSGIFKRSEKILSDAIKEFQALINELEEKYDRNNQGKVSNVFIKESSVISDYSTENRKFKDYLENKYAREVIAGYEKVLEMLGGSFVAKVRP